MFYIKITYKKLPIYEYLDGRLRQIAIFHVHLLLLFERTKYLIIKHLSNNNVSVK